MIHTPITSDAEPTKTRTRPTATTEPFSVPIRYQGEKTHPGEMLREEFLLPMGLSAYGLAKAIGVSQNHIGDLLRGERRVTANLAVRLSVFLGTTAEFWLNLQAAYDLAKAYQELSDVLPQIEPYHFPHLDDIPTEIQAVIEDEENTPRVVPRSVPSAG